MITQNLFWHHRKEYLVHKDLKECQLEFQVVWTFISEVPKTTLLYLFTSVFISDAICDCN